MRSRIVTPVVLTVVFSIQAWSQAPKESTSPGHRYDQFQHHSSTND